MSMAYLFSQNNTIRIGLQFFHKDTYFLWLIKRNLLSLHKIGCTRPFVSKLPWHSFALSLHKIGCTRPFVSKLPWLDRKSTRLNSSHANISYAVFCLKKKKITQSQC